LCTMVFFTFYDINKACNSFIQMDDRCKNLGWGMRNLTESFTSMTVNG
jgi:hypothetical protein